MVKRLMDIAVAACALVVLLPFFVVAAVWIRLDTPGPVFFRQERVGRHGRVFRIHKFRTMAHAPQGAGRQITVGADRRITRAGRWLRHTKLDELPQLIDVLLGDMSLVGPRPEVPRYVAMYPEDLKAKVLSVRPGITDPVSLEFADESELLGRAADPEREYVEVIMPKKLRAAVAYVERASVWNDLAVLAQTLRLLCGR
jgi:lipopolysaccharide/colanic/teichoic acid biosynthesis glycosyltransferase